MNLRLLSAYHWLDQTIRNNGLTADCPYPLSSGDQAQIQQCVEAMAAILLRKTPWQDLQTPEGIQRALQQHTRQPVLSQPVVHLLKQQLATCQTASPPRIRRS